MSEDRINENTKIINEGNIKTKQLFIIGEINENVSRDIIRELFETDWQKENINNLSIYIASEGGYLKDCFAMIDAIQFIRDTFGVHISTFGLGECASAGFFLFLIGDLRVLFPSCKIFVHEHITMTSEKTYSDTKKEGKDAKALYEMYVEFTAGRLGISPTRVKNLLKKNRYLTSTELAKFNIITPEESNKTNE